MLLSLQHTVMLLLQHPLTFHNVIVFIAEAQRVFLDIHVFLDFVEVVLPHLTFPSASCPVRSDWMGAFTQDTAICDELFRAGIPVWLIQLDLTIMEQTVIEKPVTFSFPNNIVRAMYSEHGKSVAPFPLLCCGQGGFSRHIHSRRHYTGMAHTDTTMESTSQGTSQVGKVPTQSQTRKGEQKQKQKQKQRAWPQQTQQGKHTK